MLGKNSYCKLLQTEYDLLQIGYDLLQIEYDLLQIDCRLRATAFLLQTVCSCKVLIFRYLQKVTANENFVFAVGYY